MSVDGQGRMGMVRAEWGCSGSSSCHCYLHKNQGAEPSTLKVSQKVLLLLSETFYPTESRLICHRGLSKGVRPALCLHVGLATKGAGDRYAWFGPSVSSELQVQRRRMERSERFAGGRYWQA